MATKHILLFFFLLTLQHHALAKMDVVRAAYWFPGSGFAASDIDSTFFTHLYCAFADLDPKTSQISISPSDVASFSSFTTTVQKRNPSVQTLLSIGGGNSSPATFASMARNPSSRNTFIESSIKLARSFGFHGVDLDWEYPKTATDMENMGLLLNEWRSAIVLESKSSGKPPLFLSAAVHYTPTVDTLSYPSKSMAKNLDWINVMAYDFTSPTRSNVTRPHAALHDPSGRNISASHGIKAWKKAGMPSKKIVLGLPFYGYAWRLLNSGNHDLDAPARGPVGSPDGAIGYKKVNEFVIQKRATTVFDADIVANYCYAGTTWINFDEYNTIFTKVAYAKRNGLLGYFAWHVGVDDNWMLSREASQAWEA